MHDGFYKELYPNDKKRHDEEDIENVLNQPYRTTPLVLPGAKVKREGGPTESYLRHHPNPAMHSSPHSYDPHEYAMKQRVADSVIQKVVTEVPTNLQIAHKQFNSPIQLYTEQNIVDTIKNQSGITTPNGTYVPKGKIISKKYDPMLSETYKAIQEEENDLQDVSPIAPKVFTPPGPRIPQPKKQVIHHPPPHSPPHSHMNSLGAPNDAIQQSGSFKRLMYHVMADI
jgi:hypothetical protein